MATWAASTTYGLPFSIGPLNTEFVTLTPAASDYAAGGYLPAYGSGIAMKTALYALPIGGQGGFVPVWNPTTGKIQMFQQSAATGALTECTASEDLSAQVFSFWLIGY